MVVDTVGYGYVAAPQLVDLLSYHLAFVIVIVTDFSSIMIIEYTELTDDPLAVHSHESTKRDEYYNIFPCPDRESYWFMVNLTA